MKSIDELKEIWTSLEQETITTKDRKILSRRLIPNSMFNVFIAIEKPSNQRMLNIQTSENQIPDLQSIGATRGLEVKKLYLQTLPKNQCLFSLQLINLKFKDIFTILVYDILNLIGPKDSEREMITALLVRINKWQKFLNKFKGKYLSEEAQRGLLGELIFFKDYVIALYDQEKALDYWKGPLMGSNDFKNKNWAVEIKTSATGTKKSSVFISSEYQLQGQDLEVFYLWHIIAELDSKGLSLPMLIQEIKNNLKLSLLEKFNGLLIAAGYLDSDSYLYENTKFKIIEKQFYEIKDNFPRIIASFLPREIHNVRYKLNLNSCTEFQISEDKAISTLRLYKDD